MADGYDRFDNDGGGGASFVMGLLAGTAIGAGLGMLFAPKAGSELRNELSEQAGKVANSASEGYRRASESAEEWAEKGKATSRDMYNRAREAVNRGTEEAERYVRETKNDIADATASMSSTGSKGSGAARA